MANQFINSSELDFIAYRDSLKEFLQNQEAFQDYDFEGSNLAVLLDLLAYNSTMNAYYENMVGSEMFLDSALLRNSVISKAKELNYIPRSRSAARANVTFTVDGGLINPSTITIPKYYIVKSQGVDANNVQKEYNFVTLSNYIIKPDSFDNYVINDVVLYQGNLVKEAFVASSGRRYVLQSENIDINTIEVNVKNPTSNVVTTWTKAENFYGLTSESEVFFVQGYGENQYEILFGNGTIGKAVSNDFIVNVNYVATDGDDANGLTDFVPSVSVEGFEVTSIIADGPTTGGSERESTESIKFQAPRYFATQERAVIDSDYETLVLQKFPTIQSVKAYGGEKLNPPQYGRVGIFVKPFGDIGIVSDSLKAEITDYLNSKSITAQVFIRDPDFFYVGVTSKVLYDQTALKIPVNELKVNVVDSIKEYADSVLTGFDKDLIYSKLVKSIDDVSNAIVGNDTEIRMIKRWTPSTGFVEKISYSYGTPLKKYNTTEVLPVSINAVVKSTPFSYIFNGKSYSVFIQDDGIGNLRLVINDSSNVVLMTNVGTVDYESGEIVLSLNVSAYSSYISISALTRNKDIVVSENRFLILDTADSNITMEKFSG